MYIVLRPKRLLGTGHYLWPGETGVKSGGGALKN